MSTETRAGNGAQAPARRRIDRAVSVHLSLPPALAERLTDAAARLGVSRSLLAREAVTRGLKGATDALRAKLRRSSGAAPGASTDANGDEATP